MREFLVHFFWGKSLGSHEILPKTYGMMGLGFAKLSHQ